MNNYQKKWGIVFGLMIFAFFGLLIYAGTTSESSGRVLQTINTLNAKSIRNILIAPENPEWKINLTVDTLNINDKNKVDELILALKKLKERNLTKGAKRFWKSILIINFDKSYSPKLENNENLTLSVFDTEEGLFIEMTNTMGYTTYACQELKPLLEKLTNYQKPLGGEN